MILRAEDIFKYYSKKPVVNGVSVELKQGEIVGLLGPNGAGKTTTFYIIVGLIKANKGLVFLDDIDVTSQPMYKRAQMGIGYLPQEASVFRRMTVENNIKAVLEMTNLSKIRQEEKCEQLLEEFGLIKVRNQIGDLLSGGERRRTEIARALATEPKFILLDEPFAGIDPIAVSDLKKTIKQLKSKNIGVVISDHNVRDTMQICDQVLIINQGKLIAQGEPGEVSKDSLVKDVYLGKDFKQ